MAETRVQDPHLDRLRRRVARLTEIPFASLDPSQWDEILRLVDKFQSNQAELALKNQSLEKKCAEIQSPRRHYAGLYRKYANLFDSAPIGYLIVDRDGFVQETNKAAALSLNAPKRFLVGRRITDFIHREDQAGFYYNKLNCQQNPTGSIFELKMRTLDGVFFDACLQMQPITDTSMEDRTFSLAMTDTGEHRHLSASLALIQDCLESSLKAADPRSLMKACLRQVKAYLQCDALCIRWHEAPGAPHRLVQEGFSRAYLEKESRWPINIPRRPFLTRRGSFYTNAAGRFPFSQASIESAAAAAAGSAHGYQSLAFIPIAVDNVFYGLIHAADHREYQFPLRVIEAVEMVADRLGLATQRLLLRQELRDSLIQLDSLSGHLLTVQEEEQQRIAMELHDGCGQDMIALKLALQGLRALLPGEGSELSATWDRLLSHCDKIIGELREIAYGLQPANLKTLGLAGATRQLIREFTTSSGIVVEAQIDMLECIEDATVQIALFRIFQESFSNIRKHARATRVRADVSRQAQDLQIRIQDNGVGFDPQQAAGGTEERHGMGLPAMALRCRMIDASLSIDTQPGRGVQTSVRIPLTKVTKKS
jgi:PAS domain S-box-containing protein